jgi:hypothetical protein
MRAWPSFTKLFWQIIIVDQVKSSDYILGASSSVITHAAVKKAGLEQGKHPVMAVKGLSGEHVDVGFQYMVPVLSGDDKLQTVKSMGVTSVTMSISAKSMPEDIGKRFPQAKDRGSKLSRPGKEVELLIGMDNQGWMPHYMGESLVEGDYLRLMQSMLGPACILMGRAKVADLDGNAQGSAEAPPEGKSAPGKVPMRVRSSEQRKRMMQLQTGAE